MTGPSSQRSMHPAELMRILFWLLEMPSALTLFFT